MYQQFIAVVKNKDHELQHSSGLIDAKNKPSTRIILIVQRAPVQHMTLSVPQILIAERVRPSHSACGQTDAYQAAT